MTFDFEKVTVEIPILRDFIDFVNQQSGVYMDCLAGFEGNTVRISRQIPRANRPTGRVIRSEEPTIVYSSVEDPGAPDVIVSTIRRSQDYLAVNAEAGFNEQQICWSIIVFVFAYWDEEIRPAIAAARGVENNDIVVDELGDLRILRKAIVHNRGIVSAKEYAKLKVMTGLVKPDHKIVLSHDEMHQLFVFIKRAIGKIIAHYVGDLPGAPNMDEVRDIGIQNAGSRNRD